MALFTADTTTAASNAKPTYQPVRRILPFACPVLLVDDIVPLLDKAQNDTSKHKTAEHGQCKTVQDIIDRSPGILGESPECI